MLRLITVLFRLLHTFMCMLMWGWGRWFFCIVDLQGETGDVGGGVCSNVPVGCFDFVRWWGHTVKLSKQLQGSCSEWQPAGVCTEQSQPSTLHSGDIVMAEGVSCSVIAKQEQTISQENSPLILLKLSLIPCCAHKNLAVVLYELLPEQNRTQVKIFSLSPGSDLMCMYIWKT